MSHLQTTPTAKSKSSRPLLPSPPGPRRLAFGSSKKADVGYGIVSASGFSAWKRGVKRGSTSTQTNSNKENTTITTGSGSNAFNRELAKKKKGPGMGLEGTPARKRYKRDSRVSKASMGTQSTPKGSISRAPTGPESPSLSISMTISSLPSGSESQIESVSSIAPIDETFAVGAETIIGEDVFGLTIAIDADGSTRPLSPDSSSTTPPGRQYDTRWFDPEEEYSNYLQEKEEFDRLVEFAEDDVPVDFGDEDVGNEGDDDTLEAIPREVIEDRSDEVDPTRIWDITVPIRETSVLSEGFNFEDTGGQADGIRGESVVPPIGHESIRMNEDDETPRRDAGKGISRKSRSQRESRTTRTLVTGPDTEPVESNRGLNISKIGLDNQSYIPNTHVISPPALGYQEPSSQENDLPDDGSISLNPQNDVYEIEEVDFTSRIPNPREVAREESPHFSSISTGETSSIASVDTSNDRLGIKATARYTKGERPRYYRATSSPTPPPPGRQLSRFTYSPTPVPSTVQSPCIKEEELPVVPDGHVWRGLWKGGKIPKSRKKKERDSGVTDVSMESEGPGRRQVEKFFIEPEYHGKAKRARDARIAHYKDLEENYQLVVEEVYF